MIRSIVDAVAGSCFWLCVSSLQASSVQLLYTEGLFSSVKFSRKRAKTSSGNL